ncbi:hypothetical protein PAECIP111894_04197 [Paenibacillus pseudetheri]|uniref:Transposase n=1 Tax=Paenibacillus pseudetheri TaxID=2897682 RepID=A0ABM9BGI9_9BACL|nr:hypothetical protein PAECIP111894_04197 [Paenibacillus pseudetheri]
MFGIKADKAYKGDYCLAKTHEEVDGVRVSTTSKFRSTLAYHRYEDVFFQTNRNWTDPEHPATTNTVHQLLLRISRTLNGEDNTYLLLQ